MTLRTFVCDSTGEIELTGNSRVAVLRGNRALFSAHPVEVRIGEGSAPTTVLLSPAMATANPVVAREWRGGVWVRADQLSFTNGGGWTARLTEQGDRA